LAVVVDAYSRRFVGWAMADHVWAELVVEARYLLLVSSQDERASKGVTSA
jgi:putative transposase